jgi:ABC-type antimicrobial peptide transport system permease subunit
MVVPSISASLQEGLSSYGNSIATYMFVYNTGQDDYESRIPENVTNEIVSIEGVQEVYPIVANFTHFISNRIGHLPGGAVLTLTGSIEGHKSAVIGGQGGFPQSLISLSAGKLPENGDAAFIINGVASWSFSMNKTYTVLFPMSSEDVSLNTSIYRDFLGREYVQFNATVVGQMPYNPMLQQVDILWNPTFLQQKLGDQLYDQTFGGEGGTLFIVKAQDINQVKTVANKLQLVFADYRGYSVIYDQTTVEAQLSFQSGSGILYNLIGVTSLFSVVSMVFLVTYVFSGRRRWEVGLLITQGWNWRRVTKLFFYYYIVLGIVSVAISALLSLIITSQIGYSFQVYANTLIMSVSISPYLLASGLVISLLVSGAAAYFAVWRMKKMGLDNLLREY